VPFAAPARSATRSARSASTSAPDSTPARRDPRPRYAVQAALRCDRSRHTTIGGRERRVETITRRLDHIPVMRLDRHTHDRVVQPERLPHRVRMLLPNARRTLNVGEQEGDRPRRQLHHPTLRSRPSDPKVKQANRTSVTCPKRGRSGHSELAVRGPLNPGLSWEPPLHIARYGSLRRASRTAVMARGRAFNRC
jgi:hypothetical protein